MIELISVEQRDETRQMAYFKVDEYEFSAGNIPIALDTDELVLAWLEGNEDYYMFLILQKIYRKGEEFADWARFKTDENTNLEAMNLWIADGCRNIVGYEEETIPIYEVIEQKPFRSNHPSFLKKLKKIDDASGVNNGLKKLLKEIVKEK